MSLEQFQKQSYLNIETFRKSGQGVKTPVWFAQDGDSLYVWTQTGTGKAKRIRRDGTVNIAPCSGSGEILGDWLPARAQEDDCPETLKHVEELMKKKYGFIFSALGFLGTLRMRGRAKYTAIKIQV
jgi:PPOX class probable F420-dependent enzyme